MSAFVKCIVCPPLEYLREGETYKVDIGTSDVYYTNTQRGSGTFGRRSHYAKYIQRGDLVLIEEHEALKPEAA